MLGFAAILVTLLFGAIILLYIHQREAGLPKTLYPSVTCFALLVSLYTIGSIPYGFTERALIVPGQLVGILCLFLSLAMLAWPQRLFTVLTYPLVPAIVLLTTFSASAGANQNSLGGFLSFILFWPFACFIQAHRGSQRIFWLLVGIVGLSGVLLAASRSTWIALLGGAFTYILLPLLFRRRRVYLTAFFVLAALIISFIFIYPEMQHTSAGVALQELSRHWTGANLFSGREMIWPTLIKAIQQRPWLGYGVAATPSAVMQGTSHSSHNLYLQIALQVGLTGLIVFFCLLYAIWSVFWYGRQNRVVRLAVSFLVGTMLHQTFEVSLTQNNLSLGIAQWLPIGVGISLALRTAAVGDISRTGGNIAAGASAKNEVKND